MFVIYFKFQGNWFHINGIMAKKRCPKAMKRTIDVQIASLTFENISPRYKIYVHVLKISIVIQVNGFIAEGFYNLTMTRTIILVSVSKQYQRV